MLKDVAFEKVEGAELNGDPRYTREIYLTDGGVYDNLGLETVWNRYSRLQGERQGAYWGIDSNISNYPLLDPMTCQVDLVEPLAVIRRRLNPFSDEEQGRLINWGYAVCDAALRSHASGLAANATRPNKWPVPSQALEEL